MTLDEIKRRVRAIAQLTDDEERAHAAEDALHVAVLEAIAASHGDAAAHAAELATEALKTRDLRFERWRA